MAVHVSLVEFTTLRKVFSIFGRNFGQKSTFQKTEILSKNQHFSQKSSLQSKHRMLNNNRQFGKNKKHFIKMHTANYFKLRSLVRITEIFGYSLCWYGMSIRQFL